jgi:hypothetical protein
MSRQNTNRQWSEYICVKGEIAQQQIATHKLSSFRGTAVPPDEQPTAARKRKATPIVTLLRHYDIPGQHVSPPAVPEISAK